MSLDYDRYVISEGFPVSVLDQDTGDSYPIADGVGFVEEMCKLLNEFNEEKLKNECRLKRKSRKITDLANFNVELMEKNKELKEINQDHQDHILLLEEEKINLEIKLQKIRDYAIEDGAVKQGVIEKVVFE